MRTTIAVSRLDNYYGIMRTSVFALVAIAAVLEFAPDRDPIPLAALVVLATAYGALAGDTALSDIQNLVADLDGEIAQTHYGRGVSARNMTALKAASSGLLTLAGLAELYAIFT